MRPVPADAAAAADVGTAGAGVTQFRAGDAVMCAHTAPCGSCFWCERGEEELCERLMPEMLLGAYADYVAVPARVVAQNCFQKPPDVSYVEAAFLEPLSCVVRSIAFLAPNAGTTVAILGNGAFGILHALLLQREGVVPLLIGRRRERVELARSLGIDAIEADAAQPCAEVFERTGGRGADAVIECTGNAAVWERAPDVVRRGGVVSFFGGLPPEARVSFLASRLHYDRVRLVSPFHFTPRDVRRARDLIASRAMPLQRLVSDNYRLSDVATAFARLDAGTGLKAAIEP